MQHIVVDAAARKIAFATSEKSENSWDYIQELYNVN